MRGAFARGLIAIALLSLAGLTGCGGTGSTIRAYPAPTGEELLAAIRAHQAAVRGANMETRTTSWLGGDRVRGTVQMLVDRAGNLHFEAEVSLQGTVSALSVNQGAFVFVDYQKKTFRVGPATPDNVAALLQIPLPPQAVAAILLGDAFVPEGSQVAEVEWDGKARADVLHLRTPGSGQLWISLHRPASTLPAYEIIAVAGAEVGQDRWRVSFQDLQRTDNTTVPSLIRFAEPGQSFDDGVEIKVKDRMINPKFPENAFVLEPPTGFTTPPPDR